MSISFQGDRFSSDFSFLHAPPPRHTQLAWPSTETFATALLSPPEELFGVGGSDDGGNGGGGAGAGGIRAGARLQQNNGGKDGRRLQRGVGIDGKSLQQIDANDSGFVLLASTAEQTSRAGRELENHSASLAICTLFKNEVPYLDEWLQYHQLLGVSKVGLLVC